jgi:hypothetical protein
MADIESEDARLVRVTLNTDSRVGRSTAGETSRFPCSVEDFGNAFVGVDDLVEEAEDMLKIVF